MYALYGILEEYSQEHIGGDWVCNNPEKELVALFDTEQKAKAYVKKSKLKKPKEGWIVKYPFRERSLLRYYTDYEIEEYTKPEDPPVNPEL